MFFVVVYSLYRCRLTGNRMCFCWSPVISLWLVGLAVLSLIFLSTAIDYVAGKIIYISKERPRRRKVALIVSMTSNLAILGF